MAEQGGWTDKAGELIGKIVGNLHDRGVFVTSDRKKALEDAAGDTYDSEKATEKQIKAVGFTKAKDKK